MIDVDYNEYKKTIAENMKLIVENHKLQQRIDKVIEYIEIIVKSLPSSIRKDYANMLLIDYKKVLEILKGADK